MKRHFVIVEDDEQIGWILTEQLRVERPDSVVHTFFDPFSALEHMKRQPADLLITDLHMAGMNGFDLLHRTRQFAPELPVIMITADQSAAAQRAAARYGVKNYLPKPFELDDLLHSVERLLNQTPPHLEEAACVPQTGATTNGAALPAQAGKLNGAALPRLSDSLEVGPNFVRPPAQLRSEPWPEQTVEIVSLADHEPHEPAPPPLPVSPALTDAALFAEDSDFQLIVHTDLSPGSASCNGNGCRNGMEITARPLPTTRHFPHDALCRRFSRHLEDLHWCALLDFEAREVLGIYEANPTASLAGIPASSIDAADLLTLTHDLLWPPLLSKLGLQSPSTRTGRAAQEVQLVFPDCVLLAKALDGDKFALVLQSGSQQILPKLWEQLRVGLVTEGLVVEEAELESWPLSDAEQGNSLGKSKWNQMTNELTAELLAHFYPKETLELIEQPLQFSEPERRTQALRLELLTPEQQVEPAPRPTPTPKAECANDQPHPPWPGRDTDAELVTPMWMAEVLLSEIGPYEPRLRTDLLKGKPGAWLYQLGRYCLRTTINKRFPDRPTAEAAIQVCLRDHTALGELHAGDTFFVLTPDEDGQYWLWTVSAWLTTLEAELTFALKQHDEVALAAGLCKYAEALLCSLQLALEKRLILSVEPANFATVYEGGPLVYVDDEIEHGYCIPNIGQTILDIAEAYADWPQAVSVYLDVLGVGVCSRFKREQVRKLDLLPSLRDVAANSPTLQDAQARLIDRIRRCPE